MCKVSAAQTSGPRCGSSAPIKTMCGSCVSDNSPREIGSFLKSELDLKSNLKIRALGLVTDPLSKIKWRGMKEATQHQLLSAANVYYSK